MELVTQAKQKVASLLNKPSFRRARSQAVVTAIAVEERVISLPRPMRSLRESQVTNLLSKSIIYLVIAVITAKTGKAFNFAVQDRRLNKYGKVVSAISLVVQPAVIILTAHELWARYRSPQHMLMRIMREALDIRRQGSSYRAEAPSTDTTN